MRSTIEYPLRVFVPKPGSRLERIIREKSAIVGTLAKDWFTKSSDETRAVIDYEGDLYGAVNIKTYADKVRHAAGRHVARYPTVARFVADLDELVLVGWFDGVVVNVENAEALESWVGEYTDAELVLT